MKVLIVQCKQKIRNNYTSCLTNDRSHQYYALRPERYQSVFGIVNGCVITINVLLCILNVFPLPNVTFADIAILSDAE